VGELQQVLYALRIRRMVKRTVIAKAEKEFGPLETMTLTQIQEQIPGLSTLPDPLDEKWSYDLLCVPRLDGFDRGVTFDTYGSDSENLIRAGSAVAAEWVFGTDASDLRKKLESEPEIAREADKAFADQIERRWGGALNKQLQIVPTAYFRVAVHEIGHAMGLDHNFKDYGFMNTTDSIADDELVKVTQKNDADAAASAAKLQVDTASLAVKLQAQTARLEALLEQLKNPKATDVVEDKASQATLLQVAVEALGPQAGERAKDLASAAEKLKGIKAFPGFIEEHFEVDDLNQLRFGPDITVRPGTSSDDYGPLSRDAAPSSPAGLELEASPLLASVPFGAPVRINMTIKNTSGQVQHVPISLSLKTGVVDGSVVDPDGNERTFWPLKKAEDSDPGWVLSGGETRTYAMTLLRGAQKALFPRAGDHRVKVTVTWRQGGVPVCLEREAAVNVSAAVNENHRAAALKIISTPETLLSLAIVGDQFDKGNEAIAAALKDPILKPHFAVVEAKRLMMAATPDPLKACELIDFNMVMSFDEIERICELLGRVYPSDAKNIGSAELERAVGDLEKKIDHLLAEGSIEAQRAEALKTRLQVWKPAPKVATSRVPWSAGPVVT
jgi:hypothetical protein